MCLLQNHEKLSLHDSTLIVPVATEIGKSAPDSVHHPPFFFIKLFKISVSVGILILPRPDVNLAMALLVAP